MRVKLSNFLRIKWVAALISADIVPCDFVVLQDDDGLSC